MLHALSLSSFLGAEFRVGRSPGRYEENAERHAARRERQGRKRQVQNPASNPPGQHQAAHWWVWVHVNPAGGWTRWWNKETVSVIAMPTPHFLCKAPNLLPPWELHAFFFYWGERAGDGLCSFSLAKASQRLASRTATCFLELRPRPSKTHVF